MKNKSLAKDCDYAISNFSDLIYELQSEIDLKKSEIEELNNLTALLTITACYMLLFILF